MKQGYLSEYFSGVGSKIFASVDTPSGSNQHEIGDQDHGNVLMEVLGSQPRTLPLGNRFPTTYIWLGDEQESIFEEGYSSWYNTRKSEKKLRSGKTRTPEWRLYYQTNEVTKDISTSDRLFIAKRHDDHLVFIVTSNLSPISNSLLWALGLKAQNEFDFYTNSLTHEDDTELDFITRLILEEIGIEYEDPTSNTIDSIIGKFGLNFPSTREFSLLARQTLPSVSANDDPDLALSAWLNHEDKMFRALEKKIIHKRLESGFETKGEVDVEGFLKFSKSVHQTRYSRMGKSLEHHLAAVFDAFDLKYTRTAQTENKTKPDFLFPSEKAYWDSSFPESQLVMMGSKSSCKDRWRQVLSEAKKIKNKHLFTLETSISENQTNEMQANNLQLILPKNIHSSYKSKQQEWLMSLSEFIKFVQNKKS